jgi:hypothetical protein
MDGAVYPLSEGGLVNDSDTLKMSDDTTTKIIQNSRLHFFFSVGDDGM